MSVLFLAAMGGLVSFVSTSIGVLLSLLSNFKSSETRWNLSIDFALGLMVSASAFTLIGPAALKAQNSGNSMLGILVVAMLGMFFIYLLKNIVEIFKTSTEFKTSYLILASVLMLHNFPEGLASGSALAGLEMSSALTILSGIAIQNVPEGLLMVVCLKAMGWSPKAALLGGFASGLVELFGGILAGLLLQSLTGILPFLLSFAGGSMMASVIIEIFNGERPVLQTLKSKQFAFGILALPFLQLITG